MLKMSVGATLSALVVAGLFSLSGMGAASAESVMKQCGEEWKAAKAAGSTNGQSWSDFLKTCRAQKAAGTAAPAPAPMAAPAAVTAPAPAPAPAVMKPAPMRPKPAPTVAAAPTGAGEFASDTEAKGHCPSDTVVWVNTKKKKYHYPGTRWYGKTKVGAYMCMADANAAGDEASKSEKMKQ
jgi:hypothetical protein